MESFLKKIHITEFSVNDRLSVIMPVVLVWLVLVLLPFGRLAELPGAIMLIIAVGLLINKKIQIWQPPYKYFTIAFALIWLPMMISTLDAVAFEKSLKTAVLYARFYFSGLFIIWVLRDELRRQLFIKLTAWLAIFWALDGLLQFITGYDILGYEPRANKLTGVFAAVGLKLGHYLAIASAFVLVYLVAPSLVIRGDKLLFLMFVSLIIGLVVILSGSRASWVMLLTSYFLYFLLLFVRGNKKVKLAITGFLVVALIGLFVSYHKVPWVNQKVNQTLLLFSEDEKSVDLALSYRGQIWKTAMAIVEDNSVNGVGVRGFRYIYTEYAPDDDMFVGWNTSPTHPHQVLVEILTETGYVGIAGYFLFLVVLLVSWLKAEGRRQVAYPAAITAVVVVSPLNVHWALYSSAWGQLFFYFIAIYMAYIAIPKASIRPTAAT